MEKVSAVIYKHVARRGMDIVVVLTIELFAVEVDCVAVLLDTSAMMFMEHVKADDRMAVLVLTKSINAQKRVSVPNFPLALMAVVL